MNLEKFKDSTILILGAGNSTLDVKWENVTYDYLWTCNDFFLLDRINNVKVDLVTLGHGTNLYDEWKGKYQLHIIGTGGCRSRAIPCNDLEYAKFDMMHQAKADVVLKHTKWIQTIVAKVKRFEQGIKQMTKFSQVEKFAKHPKVNWQISPEILADKIGMDIVVSIDDLADSIESIGKPKETKEEKIKARLAYEQWQQSSSLAS